MSPPNSRRGVQSPDGVDGRGVGIGAGIGVGVGITGAGIGVGVGITGAGIGVGVGTGLGSGSDSTDGGGIMWAIGEGLGEDMCTTWRLRLCSYDLTLVPYFFCLYIPLAEEGR